MTVTSPTDTSTSGLRWRSRPWRSDGDHGGGTRAGRRPDDERDDRELTVDELAARVGVTVRNLRAYSARGLLPPPRMVGRTGYYGREHVARLLLVREMLAEGYSLAMIERTLASAPPLASSATLALHRALLAPWLPPEPEFTTGAELAARAGVPENSALVDQLVELGLLQRLRRRPADRARPGAADRGTAGRRARGARPSS